MRLRFILISLKSFDQNYVYTFNGDIQGMENVNLYFCKRLLKMIDEPVIAREV